MKYLVVFAVTAVVNLQDIRLACTQQTRRAIGPFDLSNFAYDEENFSNHRRQTSLDISCGMLASQIANSPERRTIIVGSFGYICFKNDSFKFNRTNLTLRSLTAENAATLTSQGSQIFVSSTGIIISDLIFQGIWEIFVSQNSSLTLRDISLEHASISIAKGASLSIEGLTASRYVGTFPALAIFVNEGYINIVDTMILDDQDGTLLSIAGDDSTIILRNLTVQAAQPKNVTFTENGALVNVSCINATGNRINMSISDSLLRLCGNGGIILSGGSNIITMKSVMLFGNNAEEGNGGGVSVIGPAQSLTMISCHFIGNNANFNGGAIFFLSDDGILDIRETLLEGNQAIVRGGAVFFRGLRGNVSFQNCKLLFNIAFTSSGGAVFVDSDGGQVSIVGCNMTRNIGVVNGGALASAADSVRIAGSVFDKNVAVGGGGAYISARQAAIRDSNFTSNSASVEPGGGLWYTSDIAATLNVSDSSFTANSGTDGGGIAVGPCVCSSVLSGVYVSSNIAQGAGGGLSYVGAAAETGVRGGMLDVIGSAFDSNAAQLGPGGGISVVSSAFRIVGTSVSANRAGDGGGGGIAVTGSPSGPSPSEEAMWLIAQSKVSGNVALGNGGGILASNMSSPPKLIANGSGVPFAFGPGGESVLCRGTGNINDLDVTLQRFVPNGSECIEVLHSYEASAVALGVSDPEALALAVSADLSVLLVYLNYAFRVVAFRMADNVVLGSFPAPVNPEYTVPNETPMVPSSQYPLFVPLVANTDFNNRAIYGGWALSYAEGAGRLFASTFHRTLEYTVTGNSFRELVGCSGGVSAMVFSEADRILYLARFTNVGLAFQIYFYDPATGQCILRQWSSAAPLLQVPIRAMGISSDGKQLFFAEDYKNADNATQTDEDQILKIVDLSSGVVSLLYQGPGSGLILNSVVAILQPAGWSRNDVIILTAPGGFQGGPFGTTPARWSVYGVQVGGDLRVLNSTLVENSAGYSGGGMAAMDDSVVHISWCSITNNSAGDVGGGAAFFGKSATAVTVSNITFNSALMGAGIGLSDLARLQISDSRVSWNRAGESGGAVNTGSSLPLVLVGRVAFVANFAGDCGGVLYVQPNQQQQACVNQTNAFMIFMDSESSVQATQNKAGRAGGALYDGCWQVADSVPLLFSSSGVVPDPANTGNGARRSVNPLPSGWHAERNVAPYGPLMATGPGAVLVITAAVSSYFPGEQLDVVLAMIDGFGQLVQTNGGVSQYLTTVSLATSQSGLVSQESYFFGVDGYCDLSSVVSVLWPSSYVSGSRHFDTNMSLTISVKDLEDAVLFSTYVTTLRRKPCEPGHSYNPLSRTCLACLPTQYVIPPYDSNECVDCPLGGKCNGSILTGRIKGSVWEAVGDFMRISECPAGYILVRDETQPILDDCVQCPAGKYESEVATFGGQAGSYVLWTPTGSSATALCNICPDGFQCNGGHDIGPAQIEIFPLTESDDYLKLSPCREKLSECGSFTFLGSIKFLLVDHSNRSGAANLTYKILMGNDLVVAGTALQVNETNYLVILIAEKLGSQIIAVYLDGRQLSNSPFLFNVQLGVCPNSSGRVMDIEGNCVCPSGKSVEVAGSCVPLEVLVPSIILPVILLLMIIAISAYLHIVSRTEDLSWRIDSAEIVFPDPKEILGIGSNGYVLRVSFRGTPVALKQFRQHRYETSLLSKSFTGDLNQVNSSSSECMSNSTFSTNEFATVPVMSFNRLLQDVKTLARLRHPYLTTIMGALVTGDGHFKEISLVMEVMDLGSMWDLLHNEMYPIQARKALRFLQDITKGMHFLHYNTPPLVHGDLKSTNILIDRNFCAKISDFGLSSNKKPISLWAAPECLTGQECTTFSDVYSFGVVIYEVMSRKVPFETDDLEQDDVFAAISRGELHLPQPPGCSAQLYSLMTECLCLAPTNRPPFAELSRRLDAMDVKLMSSDAFTKEESNQRDRLVDTLGFQSMVILRDLFPSHVADALMRGEKVPPERKEMITMYFSDIVGFTTLSAALSPEMVSDLLDRLFGRLDALAGSYSVYKVDTIGDAYLCATNVLMDNSATHAVAMAHFALAALAAAQETLINPDDPAMGHVQMRIGLSSGPCMASVVGRRNPKYTFFGDTINTASRMESTSVPGYVQCSQRTADLLQTQDIHSSLRVVKRGSVAIKGKGHMVTYWILLPDQDPPNQAGEPLLRLRSCV